MSTQCRAYHRRHGNVGAFEGVKAPHEVHELARLQEDQATGAVMVGQSTERLVAQRHPLAEPPRRRPVKDIYRCERHDLVDPAESVYRHLFDEQLFDVTDYLVRLFLRQCFARHVLSLVRTKSNVSRQHGGTRAKLRR